MDRWTHQINKTTQAFQDLFGHLSNKAMNWKPQPDKWSIGQNIDHLIVINQTYFPILDQLKTGSYPKPFMASVGFLVSFMGKTILNASTPDRSKKMKTFPIWEPSSSHISEDILERFTTHQQELTQHIQSSEPFLTKKTVIASPANKHILYTLETAFDIIVAHEQRHLEQSKETLALLERYRPQGFQVS